MADVKIIPARDRSGDVIRTAAYARVSSDSDDQINSFSAQIQYYTEYLSGSSGMAFVDMYADEGLTGTEMARRTEFNRMISDCRKGKIDRILTKSVSRFARNSKECIEVIRELKLLGISVYFEKEDIDTEEMTSELILTLHAQFAQEESMSISKNCRMGVHKRMADGTYINSSVPYGYKFVDGKTVVDDEKAEIVRGIFESFLNGSGTERIANDLNKQGAPIPQYGKKWHHTAVMIILRNERYIGDSLFQKSFVGDELPYRRHINKGEKPQYYAENTHPAIISKETFEAAQRLIECRKVHPTAKMHGHYPLSKMIRCGKCGSAFRRKVINGTVVWVCRTHNNVSASECPTKSIPETEIYTAFITLYNKLAAGQREIFPSLIRQLQELADRKISGNSQILEIRKEIADVKEKSHLTARLKSQGILDDAYYTAKSKELDSQLLTLQKQLRSLADTEQETEQICEIRQLAAIFENAELITEFDETLFAEIVQKITVISETEIRFTLCGGVEFSEQIERKGRR